VQYQPADQRAQPMMMRAARPCSAQASFALPRLRRPTGRFHRAKARVEFPTVVFANGPILVEYRSARNEHSPLEYCRVVKNRVLEQRSLKRTVMEGFSEGSQAETCKLL
jgi:hypothetical protein